MQKRATRITLLALLLAVGIAAALFVWDAERRVQSIETERQAVAAATERLLRAVGSISAAQQAYVDYGQRDEASFARVADQLEQITTDGALLRASAADPASGVALTGFEKALASLRDANGHASSNLLAGESLTAADILFDVARQPVAAMDEQLRAVRQAESARFTTERAAVAQRSWMAIAAVALMWTVGLVLLTPVPVPAVPSQTGAEPAALAPVANEPAPALVAQVARPVTPAVLVGPPQVAVDLEAAAALCAEISRLTDTAALAELLGRAATILDARGIVLWMGAGEELFAAAAHGYDPAVIGRMRPIARGADNATAAAWSTGELRTVAGNNTNLGAIVAPIAGAAGAVGVIAAEVRHGRETDGATRAVTAIIAAQLAAVLSAWPAASTVDSTADVPAEPDQQAAAS